MQARLIVKNGHQKGTCYDYVELQAQNVDVILGSEVMNTTWRTII